MSNVDNSPNNGGTGGLLHNAGAIGVALIVGFFFWPAIVPFSGVGENWKVTEANWIALIAWWILLIVGFFAWQGYRGTPGQQDSHQQDTADTRPLPTYQDQHTR